MANAYSSVGGGGGAIYLRAQGQKGNVVTATLGDKVKSGTIDESGALMLRLPGLGLWKVKTQSGSFSYEQDVKVYRYGITPCWAVAKKAFAECTPAEIQFIAQAGLAPTFWERGDKRLITMTDGEEIYAQIADFDHDYRIDGKTKIPLTLVMEDCFKATQKMNNSDTNAGGWENCVFRTVTLPSLRNKFPEEWRAIMTTCQKKTSAGSQSSVINTTNDDLFLLSEVEIFGTTTYSFAGEGDGYPIFTDANSRVKRVNGAAATWWERSPNTGNSANFCRVAAAGAVAYSNASYAYGIALGFCVG